MILQDFVIMLYDMIDNLGIDSSNNISGGMRAIWEHVVLIVNQDHIRLNNFLAMIHRTM